MVLLVFIVSNVRHFLRRLTDFGALALGPLPDEPRQTCMANIAIFKYIKNFHNRYSRFI